jgi:general secretion pathway protein J
VKRHPASIGAATQIAAAPCRNAVQAQAGFTLLEVLAALVVLGLILAALTSGVRFGQQALLTQARDASIANQIDPVDNMLRSVISRAWPASGATDARFSGTARTLAFRTTMPERHATASTREADVTIGVDTMHRLVLTWLPWYRNWIVVRPRPERVALLDKVDHVEFAFWDPSLNLPPGGWVTTWNGPEVPKLLRIRLVFAKGDGLRWPDIIVAPAREPWIF